MSGIGIVGIPTPNDTGCQAGGKSCRWYILVGVDMEEEGRVGIRVGLEPPECGSSGS